MIKIFKNVYLRCTAKIGTEFERSPILCRKLLCTVCPGSSDPPEKIFNIFASENEVYTIYYNTLG